MAVDNFDPPLPKIGVVREYGELSAQYHRLANYWQQADPDYYHNQYVPENNTWRKFYILSNIPLRYWDYKYKDVVSHWLEFNNFDASVKTYRDYIENLGKNLLEGRGLYIHGSYGSCKTTAATVVLKTFLAKFCTGFFWNSKLLLEFYKQSWEDENKQTLFNYIKKVDVLVIDDAFSSIEKVGISKEPEQEASIIEKIFIERCDNCKPTIFTANHKLESNFNLVGGAVYSRMVGFLTVIQPKADDKRIANRIEDDSAQEKK